MQKNKGSNKKTLTAVLILAAAIIVGLVSFINGAGNIVNEDLGIAETVISAEETAAAVEDAAEETSAPAASPESEETPGETAEPDITPEPEETPIPEETAPAVIFGESYSSRDDVALYIHLYGCLPENYITKNEAQKLGWEGGSLEPYAPGCAIGGDRFGNYEGLLPDGVSYTECDIDTVGSEKRGAKRIIFGDDGSIYYTGDHYESFELLYSGEGEP